MANQILIIMRSAPYGSSLAREGLDYILTSAAYDQNISVLFLGDGLFQLIKSQQADKISLKSQISAMEILPLYDIENLYVAQEDMTERGINSEQFGVKVNIVNRPAISPLIQAQDKVLNF